MPVQIITDSTATLTQEQITENKLEVLTLFIVSKGKSTPEITMDVEAYYKQLGDLENLPTTSQPTPASFRDAFLGALEKGNDVLGIFTSGGLSGTIEGAHMVRDQIEAERPEFKDRIAIVDSLANGMALSYPVLDAAKLALEGADLDTCRSAAEYASQCTRFLFAPLSLEHLRRGGRIGRASFLLGSVLQMCPILGPDKLTGSVHTYAKIRTFKRALETIKDMMLEDAKLSKGLKAVCVHYIAQRAEAETYLKNVVQPATAELGLEISFAPVPPTIGTHVGPAVGIAYQTAGVLRKENEKGIGL